MALTRTLIRAVIYNTPFTGRGFAAGKCVIIPDNRESMFVTAVYGVLSHRKWGIYLRQCWA